MKCVNINSPEFKSLLKETNLPSFKLSPIVGILMEQNSSDDYFPSKEDVYSYLLEGNQQKYDIIVIPELTDIANQAAVDIKEYNQFVKSKEKVEQGNPRKSTLDFYNNSKFKDLQNPLLNLGMPSAILKSVGVPNLPIKVLFSHFQTHILDNPEHEITAREMAEIMRGIHNPLAIYINRENKAYGRTNRLEILTPLKNRSGDNIVVVLELNRPVEKVYNKVFQTYDYKLENTINTGFAVKNLARLQGAIDTKNLLFINKERIKDALQGGSTPTSVVNPKAISDSSTILQNILEKTKDFRNKSLIEEVLFNLSTESSKLLELPSDNWFDVTISPLLDKLTSLFPQVKTQIINEANDFANVTKEAKDKLKLLKEQGKVPNSFYYNGTVYIIKDRITPEIAIEEFLHPFVNALEVDNPQLFKNLLLEAKKLFPEMKDKVFKDYKEVYDSITDLNREFLTQALARMMEQKRRTNETASEEVDDTPIEVNNWFDKFIDWIKSLFNKVINPQQVEKYNYNVAELDQFTSLNDLAILLSKEGTTFDSILKDIDNRNQEDLSKVYWAFTEEQIQRYFSYPMTNGQKDTLTTLIAKTEPIKRVETKDGHKYVLAISEDGSVNKDMRNVTSIVHPNAFTGNPATGRFGTTIHKIADLINEQNKTSFTDQELQDLIEEVGLKEFTADFNYGNLLYEKKDVKPSMDLAIYITRKLSDYILSLKQSGSLVLSEIILGDPESLIAGTADLIEIKKDGSIVIHDFKSISVFLDFKAGEHFFSQVAPGFSLENYSEENLTEVAKERMEQAWKSQYRKPSYSKQLSLYKALLSKTLNVAPNTISLQIVPFFYKKGFVEDLDTGQISKTRLAIPYSFGRNEIFFPIEINKNEYTGLTTINSESAKKYSLDYDRVFVTKHQIKTPSSVTKEDAKKKQEITELEKITNSEKFDQVINDIFIQINKIVTQYGKSSDKTKQEIYNLFVNEAKSAGEIASIKLAISDLYESLQQEEDVQSTAVKFAQLMNYMNETFKGIEKIKESFIGKTKNINTLDLNDPGVIYQQVQDLRAVYQFAKSFSSVINTLVAETNYLPEDNLFKQMVSKAQADIINIEVLYTDNIIPLLARGLELQISPEIRESVNKELEARISIEKVDLENLPANDKRRASVLKRIEDLEKQRDLMSPDKTIFAKMIEGDYGDASVLWSNLIANINNPDMIIAAATKILSNKIIDLNTMSNTVFHAYGKQLDKQIQVMGDNRKDVKKMNERLTYKVKKIRRKKPKEGQKEEEPEIWEQLHLISEIDENVYYEHDVLKIELERAREQKDKNPQSFEEALKKLKEFEKKNFEPEYTEEVERVLNSLDIDIRGVDEQGNSIVRNPKLITETILKKIQQIVTQIPKEDYLQGRMSEDIKDELDALWKEYKALADDFDSLGNEKSAIDKKVAEIIRARQEALNKVRKRETNTALWQHYRDKAKQLYGEDSAEFQEWEANNTIYRVKDEVYRKRDEIQTEIREFLNSRLQGLSDTEQALVENMQKENEEIWKEIFRRARPYRKQNVIRAREMPDKIKSTIEELEKKAADNQKEIKQIAGKMSAEEAKFLNKKFKELEDLFVTAPTEDYFEARVIAEAKVKAELGTSKAPTEDQMYAASDNWFRRSHIREVNTLTGESTYKPVYYYRVNKSADPSLTDASPASQYNSFELPKNPNYLDMFNRRKVKKTSVFYRPENYRKLEKGSSSEDKALFETLQFLARRAEDFQKGLHSSNQLGYAIPTMRKGIWDRLMDGSLKNSYKNFKDLIIRNEQDRDEGIKTDEIVITDLAGEETRFLPVRYTSKIDAEEQSYDVFKSFFLYEMSSRKAQMLEETKGFFDTLNEQLTINTPKKANVAEAITSRLSEKFKDFGINVERPKGTSNERADTINDLINRIFYDEYKRDWLAFDTMFGRITDTKVIDPLLGFAGSRMMFGNIWNWSVNFISGNIQTLMMAAGGRYFTEKDVAWAFKEIRHATVATMKDRGKYTDLSFFTQMERFFNPYQGEYENELGERLSWTEWTKGTKDIFFSGKIFGEWEIQTKNFLAMMHAKKVQQIQTDGTKKTITFWDAFEKGKEGNPVLKEGVVDMNGSPITQGNIQDYIRRIQGVNKALNGAYAKIDQLKMEKYAGVRALTFMRKYFAPMFAERFGGLRTDLELGDVREGYYRTTMQLLYEWVFLKRSLYKRYKEGTLTPLQQQNIKRMMREIMVLVMFSIIIGLLGALGADDDDEALKMARYVTNKVKREFISTVPIPGMGLQEFYSVFASPFIAMGQIGNAAQLTDQMMKLPVNFMTQGMFFEEDLYYQRATGIWEKGDSKVLSSILKVAGVKTNIFNADELEKLYEYQVRWK